MSSFINKALFFEHLKRFWAISVIPVLLYLMVVYVPVLNAVNNSQTLMRLMEIITMSNTGMMLVVVLTPVAAAFCVFGSFFNKQAATFYYSAPLSKRQLFITNALSGLVLSLVPVLIFCVVLLFPINFEESVADNRPMAEALEVMHGTNYTIARGPAANQQAFLPPVLLPDGPNPNAPINSFPIIGGLFLRLALTTIFYFAVAWLAFSLAGHGFIALLLVAVLPFMPYVTVMFAERLTMMLVFGFGGDFGLSEQFLLGSHNPAVWSLLIRGGGDITRFTAVILPTIVYTVLAAGLFVGAYFISRARRPERTGNSIMFHPVKNVLIFIVSLVPMLLVGALVYLVTESIVMLHIGFVAGFAIGYTAAQMIAEKSFHVLRKMRFLPHFLGTAAAIYVAVLLFTQFGMGFYVNRVLAQDEIYGVHITNRRFIGIGMDSDMYRMVSISDPDFIEGARHFHQTILDARSELHSFATPDMWERTPEGFHMRTAEWVNINYS